MASPRSRRRDDEIPIEILSQRKIVSKLLRPRLGVLAQPVGYADVNPPITEPPRADNAEMYAISMSLCRDVGATIVPARGAVCIRRDSIAVVPMCR
jgi:hypothetical protein